ncbi:MAG: hypothetical protein AABW89_03410 [Nanoarchaeota archaeon]
MGLLHSQKLGMANLVNERGFESTPTFFTYTSGEIGPDFVFSERIMRKSSSYRTAIRNMADLVRRYTQKDMVISGGETRDFIFSNPVALNIGLPSCMIYKDGRIIGAEVEGRNVIHVADLNNEGSSVRDCWVPAIRKAGGIIEHVFFYVDRCESDTKIFDDLGIETHAFLPLNDEMWKYLLSIGVTDEETDRNVRERMKDKREWARRMLRSHKGLDRLAELAGKNHKEFEKVRKVLNVGYPELREELICGLSSRGIVIA